MLQIVLITAVSLATASANPFLAPSPKWVYSIEAVREEPWPTCSWRFLSFPAPDCNAINLWNGAGMNEEFQLEPIDGVAQGFHIKSRCGRYVGFHEDCGTEAVVMLDGPGNASRWAFVRNNDTSGAGFATLAFDAVGRVGRCSTSRLGFPVACTTKGPEAVVMVGRNDTASTQWFRLFPVARANKSECKEETPVSDQPCPDPFTWLASSGSRQFLSCTGGTLPLSVTSPPKSADEPLRFTHIGSQLGGHPAAWCEKPGRWAPETHEIASGDDDGVSVMVVSDIAPGAGKDLPHRIGYVVARGGMKAKSWNGYSPQSLVLSTGEYASHGDIDPHIFIDPVSQQTFLLWKSDDNRVGDLITHIWSQQIHVDANGTLQQLSEPIILLDSSTLWWAQGFNGVNSALIEGPEMVFIEPYYYLFFAAGQYCGSNYAEGVARSASPQGPFEKLMFPVISAALVGTYRGAKLKGTGHATFFFDVNLTLRTVYHAHVNNSDCVRYAFEGAIDLEDQWPALRL